MQKKQAIAVFGGAFNPPLNSHIYFVEEVLKKVEQVEKVIFVPVSNKYKKSGLIEDEHRYNMLRLVCKKYSKLIVSNIEIKSKELLYTVETLELIKQKYLDYNIYFMMGSDNLKELSIWKNPDKLLSNFKAIILKRNEDNINEIIENNEFLKKYKNSFIKLEYNENKNLSSTQIRKMIKNNENIDNYMPKEILEYIKTHELYRL